MRALLALAALAIPLPAQSSAVLDALTAGDVSRALDMLTTGAPEDTSVRLQVIRLLVDVPRTNAALYERALGRAALILPERAPSGMEEQLRDLAAEVGRDLTRLLVAHTDLLVDGRITDRTQLGAGVAAYQALRLGGLSESRDMLSLGMHLAPLLLAGERPRDAAAIATDALAATPTPAQETALHSVLAQAKLQLGRPEEALPHAQRVVQADPDNAAVVLPLVRAFPPSMVDETFAMLRVVIKRPPSVETKPEWIECLARFYDGVEKLASKRSTADAVAHLTKRQALPQTWFQVQWGEGYRVWLDPDTRPAKIASGKDALILPVPASAGWTERRRPPDDLARWNNVAYCLQRGEAGPTLVVYWFGPNLEYWYGDTPVERGVTGKTVRGHSAGAIARMVFDIAYDEDAKLQQRKFKSRSPLPFAVSERGQRRTFTLDDTIYDETVFSHGQVTIEVLLRVTEADLAELEPELRWMYRTLRKE